MRELVLALIRFYKRSLSPHKGFACAYRIHTGRASCSSLAYRAIRLRGVAAGFAILRERTYLCGVAHRRHTAHRRPLARQRGDCDSGCGDIPCHLDCQGIDGGSSLCDFADCCDCDWPERRKKKNKQQERYVYIPPKSLRRESKDGQSRSNPET